MAGWEIALIQAFVHSFISDDCDLSRSSKSRTNGSPSETRTAQPRTTASMHSCLTEYVLLSYVAAPAIAASNTDSLLETGWQIFWTDAQQDEVFNTVCKPQVSGRSAL